MTMNTTLKLGLATLLAAVISAPLAFAQGEGSGGAMQGEGMMQEEGMMQGGGMMNGDMPGMMGMMQMMQQMGPMIEACTEMMQAMTNQMDSAPQAQGTQNDQG